MGEKKTKTLDFLKKYVDISGNEIYEEMIEKYCKKNPYVDVTTLIHYMVNECRFMFVKKFVKIIEDDFAKLK